MRVPNNQSGAMKMMGSISGRRFLLIFVSQMNSTSYEKFTRF
jgi:hypothetical protein